MWCPRLGERFSKALGDDSRPVTIALFNLAEGLDALRALRDVGIAEADLDKAADLVLACP